MSEPGDYNHTHLVLPRRNVDMTAADKCMWISSAAATCRDRPPVDEEEHREEEEERWRDENERQQSEPVKVELAG